MTTTEVQIARGVVRMLNDQDLVPAAELAFAPSIERDDIEETLVLVAPGEATSEVIDRGGRRRFERTVDIAVVSRCQPTDAERIETLLSLCSAIGELLARHKPLDDADQPMGVRCLGVDQAPLYSGDRLRAGVFLGILSARYTP